MRPHAQNRRPAFVESLEKRRLLSGVFPVAPLNTNLLLNGDAETDTGATSNATVVEPSDWDAAPDKPNFTVVKYGAGGGLPDSNTLGPLNPGNNFFAGGPNNADSEVEQFVDVEADAAGIDAGVIKASLSAWLGGFQADDDHIVVSMDCLDASNGSTGTFALGSELAADRQNTTQFIEQGLKFTLPAGTRKIIVHMESIRSAGNYNDGYADDVSLELSTTSKTGFISGGVYNDADGDGMRATDERGVKGITVYLDKNNNGKLDKGEINAKTNKNGVYTLLNVPRGAANLAEVVPTGFREVTGPAGPTVSGGVTSFVQDFGITQSTVVLGDVFNDTNANGQSDGKEKGAPNITVYLDFNNNGQLDPFELKTTTDARGSFNFDVPFGTYVIRIQVPKGYKATNNLNGRTITIGKGQVLIGGIFGIRKV